MNIKTYDSCRLLLFCIVIFGVVGATTTQGKQQDTNDVTLLIAEVNQLKDKVKTQEDIILRANSRISELERQLTEQTKQNKRLQLLCEKAGVKITAEPDENSSSNILKSQSIEPTSRAEKIDVVRIKIQKKYDAIELDSTRIRNLPDFSRDMYFDSAHNKVKYSREVIKKNLETATEWCRLLHNIEGNLKDIIQLAKIYPELGIDVMDIEKTLIDCQKDRGDAESEKKYWQSK